MDTSMRDPAAVFAEDNALPPYMAEAYEFWLHRHTGAVLPHYACLDPVHMPTSILRWLGILEPIDQGRDFLIRLAGTSLVDVFKTDLTNTLVSTLPDSDEGKERLRWCVANRKPYVSNQSLTWVSGRDHIDYHALALPFVDDDGQVVRVMMVFAFGFSSAGTF